MLALRLLYEGGKDLDTSLIFLLLIGMAFLFLLILVGWQAGGKKQDPTEIEHEAKITDEEDAGDLVKIEGIGLKVARVLQQAGITTFAELAHAKSVDVQQVLDAAGLRTMNPEGWIAQANLAAKGDWAGFEKMQSELKGGRKTR